MQKSDKLLKERMRFFSDEEILLLQAIEPKTSRAKKSKLFKKAEERINISERIRLAIRSRRVNTIISLLDGKPLKDVSVEVRKAYLIQIELAALAIWDPTFEPTKELLYDLLDDDPYLCKSCWRFIGNKNRCEYCGLNK